ncbi:MAG: hypothetical protein RBT45_04550 [Acholeplasmataceae bacterium]|jgi:hypothetical protein|nr:hypothetical protein [Acholeplasmataceae bacterium]
MIHKFKKNLYLIITAITFGLSVIFAAVIFISLEVEGELNRTSVGFIYLGDKTENQYSSILSQEINKWSNEAIYTVYFQEYTFDLDLSLFDFDNSKTLQLLRTNVNNRAYFDLSETNEALLENQLRQQFSDEIIEEFDMESFVDDVISDMQLLFIKKEYQLESYLSESIAETVIDSTTITLINVLDVNRIVDTVTEIIIPKNSRFSLLKALESYTLTNNQLSIIASGIQGIVDVTSMSGFSYEQNRILPIWSTPGQNVRILQVNKYDFTFFNHLNYELTVTIDQVDEQTLEFRLIGYPFVTTYEVVAVDLMIIPYPTLYYDNETIISDPNVEITDSETETYYRLKVQDGIDGLVIYYYREVTQLNEDMMSYRIYDEQFLPTPEIYYEYLVVKEVI